MSFRLFRYRINNVLNCILVEMALLLERKKYNPFLKKVTIHREIK